MSRWRRRVMDSAGITEYPPGPHLSRLGQQKVFVTRPGNDNIGEILTSMDVEFEAFQGSFDCSLLFVNCGTPDQVDPRALAEFVHNGGCVYASDHADTLIAQAFPGVFDFGGHSGGRGQVAADVIDPELRDVLGSRIEIEFDMGAWAVLRGGEGRVTSHVCERQPTGGASDHGVRGARRRLNFLHMFPQQGAGVGPREATAPTAGGQAVQHQVASVVRAGRQVPGSRVG